jgi:hypothetical protein
LKTLPAAVAVHLQKYASSRSQLSLEKIDKEQPASLGIYLGTFDKPTTADKLRLISNYDMIILDPLQTNVVAVVAEHSNTPQLPRHIIGRIDLAVELHLISEKRQTEQFLIFALDQILNFALTRLKNLDGSSNGFTGILLAGWNVFPLALVYELSGVLDTLGLDVYLETSGPEFLEDSTTLNSESISGLVIRNALISPNGKAVDCFEMEKLRPTVKAFVSQACLRPFTVLSWETLETGISTSPAILKRTFAWCNFHNAVPWVGPIDALFDLSIDVVKLEPLSAFDWLKQPLIMELHEIWRNQKSVSIYKTELVVTVLLIKFQIPRQDSREPIYGHLQSLLPNLQETFKLSLCQHSATAGNLDLDLPLKANFEWFIIREQIMGDPLCSSPTGQTYDGIGCFPLGVDVTQDDFLDIIWSQRNLKKLDLLDAVHSTTLQEYGAAFNAFVSEDSVWRDPVKSETLGSQDTVAELANMLMDSRYEVSEGIRVFLGLHSGFQRTPNKQFWAVYHVHASSVTDIYVSKDANNMMGTILHTFLSCKGFTRRQCFATELAFARWRGDVVLPHTITRRMSQDIARLSPDECILILQRLFLARKLAADDLLEGVIAAIQGNLVQEPTIKQLKSLNSADYLYGDIQVDDLVRSRLDWHCQSMRPHPETAAGVALFLDVEAIILRALKDRNSGDLLRITDALANILTRPDIDTTSDIFALAVFCTMRKLAFEEIYIEVLDRNPLFNDQSDQAAAFAELFALGSRCDAYFGVTPGRFGALLSAKFRNFYENPEHQPPLIKENSSAIKSAYSEAQIDVDSNRKDAEMPAYQRFTFLSVFAIPALIDILMLTTTGHGLYLSARMSYQEQHSATVALMISLLASGAIGTWITCGGTYYLASMAFSAMNYFVITRLLGGFVFTFIVALVGFIAFTCLTNIEAGIVFFLYFIVLTTYLCLLAALANFQFTGSAFQSGRAVIICCIPILFLSPLTTIFVQFHDIYIYLTILYVFITMLLVGLRRTGSRWTTWYQKISLVEDAELRAWYLLRSNIVSRKEIEDMTDPAILKLAREALLRDVLLETRKPFFVQESKDPLILKLAKSFEATDFLMNWYSRYSGVPKPINFSSAWNVQAKVALDTLQKSQLGIRFHNGFIHWRQAGDEIGCTMLYFIIALLDKWIMLITGQQLLGLGSSDKDITLPIGFGLAYYLVGAVFLDFNGNKLFELAAAHGKEDIIPTDADVSSAVRDKSHKRKLVYWKSLARYLMLHVWGLAVTSTLIWLFASSNLRHGHLVEHPSQPTIIFLGYVAAYTGLLWYQYTKIFCGPHALKPLLIGLTVGLLVGFLLHREVSKFPFSDILALGSASWTVAILSLFAAKLVGKPEEHLLPTAQGTYNAYSGPGPDQEWSQQELRGLHEKLSLLPKEELLPVDPQSDFGKQVQLILAHCKYTDLPDLSARAFPDAGKLFELTSKLFTERKVIVELVSIKHLSKYDQALRAVSSSVNGTVKLLVGCGSTVAARGEDPLSTIYQELVAAKTTMT